MPDRTKYLLLAGSFLAAAMVPASAQQNPRGLVAHIEANAPQEYILSRCAGYFQALLMTNEGAEDRLKDRVKSTIDWLFQGVVAVRTIASEDGSAPDYAGVAAEIDRHTRFYLERQLDNVAKTGQPYDALYAEDQDICVILAATQVSK